ncbi:MAG TPA: hypothetical protein VF077_09640 [Nitrospiraceae bacterium]
MAVVVITNACVAGAMGGLMAGRFVGSFTAADYANIADAAAAIAAEFIVQNTASGAALADADNANIGDVVQAVAMATIIGSGATSEDADDYVGYAKQIYAASKQALTKLA